MSPEEKTLREKVHEEGLAKDILDKGKTELAQASMKKNVERSAAWQEHKKHCTVQRIVSLGLIEDDNQSRNELFDEQRLQHLLEQTPEQASQDAPLNITPIDNPTQPSPIVDEQSTSKESQQLYGTNPFVGAECGCGKTIHVAAHDMNHATSAAAATTEPNDKKTDAPDSYQVSQQDHNTTKYSTDSEAHRDESNKPYLL